MRNNVDNLVTMANHIGDFFETMKDRSQSLEEIASHLKRFWEPRMRFALLQHVEQHGGAGLNDIVLDSLRMYQASLMPGAAAMRGSQPSA
nr:formate dehydrogenase subunit delta [uncultured Noviherbaspirillum sp.]